MLFQKPDLHISEVDDSEHGELAQIHKASFPHGWNEADIKSLLATKGTQCWGVKIRGRGNEGLKGFLILRALFEQAEIITIAIMPKLRNRGLARALMDHAVRQLRRDKINNLLLEVGAGNTHAIKLYEALHFRRISERKAYYTNPVTTDSPTDGNDTRALVMQLDLT